MFLFLVRSDGRGGELGWWGSCFFFVFFGSFARERGAWRWGWVEGACCGGFEKMGPGGVKGGGG